MNHQSVAEHQPVAHEALVGHGFADGLVFQDGLPFTRLPLPPVVLEGLPACVPFSAGIA